MMKRGALNAWLLRMALIALLLNAFLAAKGLPNGLFTAKELGLYGAAVLSSVLAAVAAFCGSVRFRFHELDGLVAGYLLVLPAVQWLVSGSPALSAMVVQVSFGLAYFSVRMLAAGTPLALLVNAIVEAFGLTACFALSIAFAQHIGIMPSYFPVFGSTGMFFNPGPFAIHLSALTAFFVVLSWLSAFRRRCISAFCYGLLFVTGVYFVVLSSSRSAWIGLSAGIILPMATYMSIVFRDKLMRWRWQIIPSVFVLIVAMIPAGKMLYKMKQDSADGRVLVWHASSQMVAEHWYTGVGLGNFAPNYIHYQAEVLAAPGGARFDRLAGDSRYAFNDIMQVAAEAGIWGALLFIAIVVVALLRLWRKLKNHYSKHATVIVTCGLMGVIVVISVAGLTAYPMQMTPIALLMWVSVALASSVSVARPSALLPRSATYAAGMIFLTASTAVGWYGVQRGAAYLQWTHASEDDRKRSPGDYLQWHAALHDFPEYLASMGDVFERDENYRKALWYRLHTVARSPAPSYYYALGACYEALADTASAKRCYRLVKAAIPNLMGPRYRIAMLHYRADNVAAFRQSAHEALDFKPKILNAEVMEMQRELRQLLRKADTTQRRQIDSHPQIKNETL